MNDYCYALPAAYNRHLPIIILFHHKSHQIQNVFIISYDGTIPWYGTVFVSIASYHQQASHVTKYEVLAPEKENLDMLYWRD